MQDSCINPTALPTFFRSRNSMKLFYILCGASGSHKSKMAVLKEEILISQHLYNIAAKFQRLYPCFQSLEIQKNYSLSCVMQAEGRNPRWRLINKKYSFLWAAILDIWPGLHQTLLRIASMSPSLLKTWVLPLEFCSYAVYRLRCKYFRFVGRHLEFLISVCITQYRE